MKTEMRWTCRKLSGCQNRLFLAGGGKPLANMRQWLRGQKRAPRKIGVRLGAVLGLEIEPCQPYSDLLYLVAKSRREKVEIF